MKRINKIGWLIVVLIITFQTSLFAQTVEKIVPGVWKVSYGTPEIFKPSEFKKDPALDALKLLPENEKPPFDLAEINFKTIQRGCSA